MAEFYTTLRLAHIGFVAISISFFIVRGIWSLTGSRHLQNVWVRTSPHIIDTLLLATAIGLAILTRQYPLQQPWLTAKVVALALYITFGSLAIKRARNRAAKAFFLLLAVLTFGYMVTVAITKSPLPLG